jgi:isopentenyl-diphosphate delta-isomerase
LIEDRKSEHIEINLNRDVQFPRLRSGFEEIRFVHQALPELNLDQVETATIFLGKELRAPILISSMTGGTADALVINRNLATAAQAAGIALGLGSQRAGIRDSRQAATYQVRDIAPDIPLFANLGAIQLNYGYGLAECRQAVDMIEADALILHLNPLQEAVQPEGDRDWSNLLSKIEAICRRLPVPVIAKEVGWGLSAQAARDLANAGVSALDVAGAGGTSWSEVEYHRAPTRLHARVAAAFADWGLTTLESMLLVREAAPQLPTIASGGLRNGIDIAKAIALGASLAGLAQPFLAAAVESVEAAIEKATELVTVLRIAMFATGAADISQLRETALILPDTIAGTGRKVNP